MIYTYQQIEVIRERSAALGLFAQWHAQRADEEAWLRVSRGVSEITMCFFPGRSPILSVQSSEPMELAHSAIEMVALFSTLTSGLRIPPAEVEP
jgi:hypothetical protein